MTKQDKIKETNGEHWEKAKDHVDDDGWCDFKAVFGDVGNCNGLPGIALEISDPYDPKFCYWKRPISISGINNNNGWIKIEQKQDLPAKKGLYMVCINNNPIVGIIENTAFIEHLYDCPEQGILTHFKKYLAEKAPIY